MFVNPCRSIGSGSSGIWVQRAPLQNVRIAPYPWQLQLLTLLSTAQINALAPRGLLNLEAKPLFSVLIHSLMLCPILAITLALLKNSLYLRHARSWVITVHLRVRPSFYHRNPWPTQSSRTNFACRQPLIFFYPHCGPCTPGGHLFVSFLGIPSCGRVTTSVKRALFVSSQGAIRTQNPEGSCFYQVSVLEIAFTCRRQ